MNSPSVRSDEGGASFQRETRWCDGCGKMTTHVRAVRTSDNWHSDFYCMEIVKGKRHA